MVGHDQLRNHDLEYHSNTFVATVTTNDDSTQKHVVRKVGDFFVCPLGCEATIRTKSGGRKYLVNKICIAKDKVRDIEEEKDLPDSELPIRALPKHFLILLDLGVEQYALAHASVIAKFSAGQGTDGRQNLFSRNPGNQGPGSPGAKLGTRTRKRKHGEDEVALTCSCSSISTLGLERTLSVSPYTAWLVRPKFVELDDRM
ncbi:hypothetical protein KI688_012733 [Linnemannia hyalina]|uniref:Uncharacterized protein n=1 Tax=Linnemannia hyalina TaxID=64524 RepID=A0A9P8BT91_9FUNG|nr:hypothetical protein KI688_012733 [Linnemannia hyalina]